MMHHHYNHHGSEHPRVPYRARNGIIFGVCKGIARHLDFSVFWFRVIVVLITVLTGLWPVVGLYLVAALLMKPEPVLPLETDEDAEFYSSFTSSRHMALMRLKRTFDRLDRRIQRMEGIVTDREYDWDRRLNETDA
jgi:phage shock protein C